MTGAASVRVCNQRISGVVVNYEQKNIFLGQLNMLVVVVIIHPNMQRLVIKDRLLHAVSFPNLVTVISCTHEA